MIRFLTVITFMVPTLALAQRGPEPTGVPVGTEREVHETYAQFVKAWNAHDVAAMAALWTTDGDYTEPDGRTVYGRDEVKRLLGYEHASVFKNSQLHLAVEHVRKVTENVAVADGSYELFGATDTRGNKIPIRSGYFTSVLAKDGSTWKVSASRLMLPQILIWRDRD
jgi:uncharacterized protein (TIGR02246 family)